MADVNGIKGTYCIRFEGWRGLSRPLAHIGSSTTETRIRRALRLFARRRNIFKFQKWAFASSPPGIRETFAPGIELGASRQKSQTKLGLRHGNRSLDRDGAVTPAPAANSSGAAGGGLVLGVPRGSVNGSLDSRISGKKLNEIYFR